MRDGSENYIRNNVILREWRMPNIAIQKTFKSDKLILFDYYSRNIIFIMIAFVYGICYRDLINSPRKYSGN